VADRGGAARAAQLRDGGIRGEPRTTLGLDARRTKSWLDRCSGCSTMSGTMLTVFPRQLRETAVGIGWLKSVGQRSRRSCQDLPTCVLRAIARTRLMSAVPSDHRFAIRRTTSSGSRSCPVKRSRSHDHGAAFPVLW